MKALRILGIAFGVTLALVAAGLVALYAMFDGEKVKAELTRVVMEKTQRKLDIAGAVELSVWPDVGIKLGRLTLSEPGGKTEFLALDSARVEVAVMPLLSKQVKIQRIEVDGLSATLVKYKDGTLNIADLTGGAADKEGATKAPPKVPGGTHSAGDTASAPVQIDISGIKIANAQLTWRDEKTRETTTLSNFDLGSGRVQADSARQTLAVDKLSLAAKGKTGTDSFELKLEVPRLNISPDRSSGETLNLTANLAGSGRTLVAKLVLSGVEGNAKALKIGKLALDLDAKAGESAFKARIDSPVSADIAAQTVALEKLAGSIDLANPQMPMKQLKLPLSGSLRADLAKQSAALDLGTRFDESNIALKLKVAKFAPLALGFDLDIDTLNVDKYMPPRTAQEKAAADPPAAGAGTKEAAEGKEDKLDFSALKGHDVNGTLRIGSLQVAKLKLAKLNAKIRLVGGRLDVVPLTMNLYEGSASGSLSLNAAGNQLGLRQNLTGISINPLMKDLADKDLLEGRGNVLLDLTSHGASVTAMKKELGGTASLNLRDGAIKGVNLAQTMRDIKAKLDTLQGKTEATTQKAKAGDKTDFSELTASLKIGNGVARNDDLAMKSPFLRLTGAGDIDIAGGQMNYLAKATLVNTSTGQGGKEVDKVKGLTVPVRITGPFDALSYKPELGDLAAEMAKAKLEEKTGALKGKAESKVMDKLKGLFGK